MRIALTTVGSKGLVLNNTSALFWWIFYSLCFRWISIGYWLHVKL